jgi:hypothetical protein
MIIAVPGEKTHTELNLLYLDGLFGAHGPVTSDVVDGTILLRIKDGKELPLYLRSELAGHLVEINAKALEWNVAIIIPDIVKKQLFQSPRLYPKGVTPFIKPKDKLTITKPKVDAAAGRVGFLEKEKLLLLEMLLGEQRWELQKIVHVLREHKVFCLKLKGEVEPGRQYLIVKFDSPAAINKEHNNFEEIKKLFLDTKDYERYDSWEEKVYKVDKPKGQDYDLFKVISSTVKTVGNAKDWTSQTLKDRWNIAINDGTIGLIINNVFSTLGDLYALGYQKQKQSNPLNPRERSINEIYRNFYKDHIMPVDCVVKCDLENVRPASAKIMDGDDDLDAYPPSLGKDFTGHNYEIEEIKLRDNKDKTPIVSFIAKNQQLRVEVRLGQLGGLQERRELYKRIREGEHVDFIGRVESNFESSLRKSVNEDLELTGGGFTEMVISRDEDLSQQMIKFIDTKEHQNPLYFYNRIYAYPKSHAALLKMKSLSTWIHGDLNGGNIITTPSGEIRVIDFARLVKDGPLEFDFAELEIDIRIRNMFKICEEMRDEPEPERLKTIVEHLFKFEETLLEVFKGKDSEEELAKRVDERFKKGFLVIAKIRKKLIEMYEKLTGDPHSGADVCKVYMTAIYFESLAALNFGSKSLAKTWALIAATVACEKLFSSIDKKAQVAA